MNIFVDTSALMAVVYEKDSNHVQAAALWEKFLEKDEDELFTTNYILVEAIALIQSRHGLDKVRILHEQIVPAMLVSWITELEHDAALSATLNTNRRKLSFVDCSSFETMRRLGIQTVFTFDEHFRERGFQVVP